MWVMSSLSTEFAHDREAHGVSNFKIITLVIRNNQFKKKV